MKPSSRTPEGEPNRCPICGKRLRLEPSSPASDAPCPFCGSLLWFNTPIDSDGPEMPNVRIRLRFRGGCRDGRIIAKDPQSLSEHHGYRYSLLALRGRVGMEWREVPIVEYGAIARALKPYGPVETLSAEAVEDIARQLGHLKTHVYEVKRREETPDEISMDLKFLGVDAGL